jgi:pimeloyl-ACP methyl ester carboxylesterase
MPLDVLEHLATTQGRTLAFQRSEGASPTIVWLGGFRSDMTGSKASHLHRAAAHAGRGFLRFDYSGHGQSEGAFAELAVGDWIEDALAMLDSRTQGPLLLVGSSMGGWISLHCALMRPARVKGLILIAPAADMTERLMKPELPEAGRRAIAETGQWERPTQYDGSPYIVTRRLLEEGASHLLLGKPIPFPGPVRMLHGQADPDVPWRLSLEIAEALTSDDVRVTLVKSGDHRLSTEPDLQLLGATVDELWERTAKSK